MNPWFLYLVFLFFVMNYFSLINALLNVEDYALHYSLVYFLKNHTLQTDTNQGRYSYYITTAQTEKVLELEGQGFHVWAIEIKRSTALKVSAGFHIACEDINVKKRTQVYSENDRVPISDNT